jgi:hypothetical protein
MSAFQQDADLENLVDTAFVHEFLGEPSRLTAAPFRAAFTSELRSGSTTNGGHRILNAKCDLIPEEKIMRLDDRRVANLGQHARHHVIQIVAVKRPTTGIVRIEGDGHAAHHLRRVRRLSPRPGKRGREDVSDAPSSCDSPFSIATR